MCVVYITFPHLHSSQFNSYLTSTSVNLLSHLFCNIHLASYNNGHIYSMKPHSLKSLISPVTSTISTPVTSPLHFFKPAPKSCDNGIEVQWRSLTMKVNYNSINHFTKMIFNHYYWHSKHLQILL